MTVEFYLCKISMLKSGFLKLDRVTRLKSPAPRPANHHEQLLRRQDHRERRDASVGECENPVMLLPDSFNALVIGSSGSIGSAFADLLAHEPRCCALSQLARNAHPGFDLRSPERFAAIVETFASQSPFGLIVDATGALMLPTGRPEKALRELEASRLTEAFSVNTIGPMLLMRHLAPLLARGPSVYLKLSARVGSISDNRKGGWYGYRASKAALNMMLQCAAVELQRNNPLTQVLAVQPGTVRSALSQPFLAGQAQVLEAPEAVAGILSALDRLTPCEGARFIDNRGQDILW
jgi:NAD(P)-dependent dehydrogenase (short-subunit alcohol dehydrogenase family)